MSKVREALMPGQTELNPTGQSGVSGVALGRTYHLSELVCSPSAQPTFNRVTVRIEDEKACGPMPGM